VSQERLSVRKIREVLRLHHEAGLSNRAIARVCKVSNSTVGEYLIRAAQASLEWPPPEGLSEDDLPKAYSAAASVPGKGSGSWGRASYARLGRDPPRPFQARGYHDLALAGIPREAHRTCRVS
jgi:hypothetical protein